MEGHQRNLYLYDRFNARVLGVSKDDVTTLKYWAKSLDLTFPLLSNITGYLADFFDVKPSSEIKGYSVFSRRTVIIDKTGIIRYVRDGSPSFKDILLFLKKLNQEGRLDPTTGGKP
jgi:peroxiredoxin Q/BCP